MRVPKETLGQTTRTKYDPGSSNMLEGMPAVPATKENN